MTTNVYPGLKTYAKNWIDQIQKEYLNQSLDASDAPTTYTVWTNPGSNAQYSIRKPFLMSEFDPVLEVCDPYHVEVRRAMWQSLFSGAAGALSWHTSQNGITYPEYQWVRNFSSQFNLDQGGWHPGAMEVTGSNNWTFRQDWADDMDKYRKGNNNQTNKADLMYLRSKDKTQAIGVITNKTYNIYSTYDLSCIRVLWDSLSDPSKFPPSGDVYINPPFEREPVNINKFPSEVNLALNGMKNGRYRIKYYRPDRLWQWEDESYNNGPKVELEYNLDDNHENYIILFHAVFDPSFNLAQAEDSISGKDLEAEYFNNLQRIPAVETERSANNLQIRLYPVPAQNVLEIQCGPFDQPIQVELQTSDGKQIRQFELNTAALQIDISGLEKGMYLLQFDIPEQGKQLHKFMKL
ncbi:MAG: Secretion system C-terminal sorting domain [Crocinitomicaceae bacterium]|jgi:hypothetical protein|nr:Secretion system C-terminal sorting domain [Crocinitomicaceae bacterium]